MRPSISYTQFPTVRLRVESGGSNAVMCNVCGVEPVEGGGCNAVMCNMCDLEPMEGGGCNVCVEPVEGVMCVWSH